LLSSGAGSSPGRAVRAQAIAFVTAGRPQKFGKPLLGQQAKPRYIAFILGAAVRLAGKACRQRRI
jgi:hypothetical protein